jgi:DNA-binding MarR family transcriptional regulator
MKQSLHDLTREQISGIYMTSIGRMLFDLWSLEGETARRMLELLGFPVTPAHVNIVSHIDVEGIRLTTLARRCHLTKQAVWEALKNLEQHGYIARVQDPTDARALLISWTGNGLDFLQVVCRGVMVRERDMARRLGAGKARLLKGLLGELRDSYAARPPDVARFVSGIQTKSARVGRAR